MNWLYNNASDSLNSLYNQTFDFIGIGSEDISDAITNYLESKLANPPPVLNTMVTFDGKQVQYEIITFTLFQYSRECDDGII